jgi:hypothetical protein
MQIISYQLCLNSLLPSASTSLALLTLESATFLALLFLQHNGYIFLKTVCLFLEYLFQEFAKMLPISQLGLLQPTYLKTDLLISTLNFSMTLIM